MKAGILFGGPSREREISFAGGRTVYDNLDKSLFEAVPLFIDSNLRIIALDWSYIYKGTIRDFYPPVDSLAPSPHGFQVYIESLGDLTGQELDEIAGKVGRLVRWEELPDMIDVAFLALHGVFGEDGQIQGILESLGIPYTGSGILASAIGMDKAIQKKLMKAGGFDGPPVLVTGRNEWVSGDPASFFARCKEQIGFPMVIRPANQGSSIGVSILHETSDIDLFAERVNNAFFRQHITALEWLALTAEERVTRVREWGDIRDGIGFPLTAGDQLVRHPEQLLQVVDTWASAHPSDTLLLEGSQTENKVLVEGFIDGKEFSCIVLRLEDGRAVALPPTEILKGSEVFDYRSKYLPGLSRKETPIQLPDMEIEAIRRECERLFEYLEFRTYARIDGFITPSGRIFLNDPNTTSGMMPSSFFFHQAAEIGLNPSQFLTYIIKISLEERLRDQLQTGQLDGKIKKLEAALDARRQSSERKKKIAVILGGYSFERHISMESGRNIYEKLASSGKFDPIPIFLTGKDDAHELYRLPVNLLLKDNADDIREKIRHFRKHPVIEQIKSSCADIIRRYADEDVVFEPVPLSYTELATMADGVFIALHGRPGEDGQVQRELEKAGLPYNGSGVRSSRITINKYDTLQLLQSHGFKVADQALLRKEDYRRQPAQEISRIEAIFGYPLIAKPVDDGCSSAVRIIRDRATLERYLAALFRDADPLDTILRSELGMSLSEEFPLKDVVLFETLIQSNGALHFMEITGGMLTHWENGVIRYEVFEPSEALAEGEVLSLEEKFLAGEGQNITPARFARDPEEFSRISGKVRSDLERAAKLLGVEGYCRIDAFVKVNGDGSVDTYIIEVNSLPGMTPATCIFHQSALNGYPPHAFIEKILEYGFEKKRASLTHPS